MTIRWDLPVETTEDPPHRVGGRGSMRMKVFAYRDSGVWVFHANPKAHKSRRTDSFVICDDDGYIVHSRYSIFGWYSSRQEAEFAANQMDWVDDTCGDDLWVNPFNVNTIEGLADSTGGG